MRDQVLVSAMAVTVFACSSSATPGPAAAPPHPAARPAPVAPVDPDAGRAPTPYTAAQIRDASRPGRTYEYLIERPGELPVRRRLVFVVVTDQGATIATQQYDPHGKKVGAPEFQEATWEQLRRHASFPVEATTISEDRTDTPVGTFDCRRYAVVTTGAEGEERQIFWFAKELPGAPVEMHVERNGEIVSRMTLLQYEPGE